MHLFTASLQIFSLLYLADAVSHLEIYPGLLCSYDYDLEVHTHRGERSTKELNFRINAKVCFVVVNLFPKYVTQMQRSRSVFIQPAPFIFAINSVALYFFYLAKGVD